MNLKSNERVFYALLLADGTMPKGAQSLPKLVENKTGKNIQLQYPKPKDTQSGWNTHPSHTPQQSSTQAKMLARAKDFLIFTENKASALLYSVYIN